MVLQSRVSELESSATQLVQQREADRQVAKDTADIGEHAAEIPAASTAGTFFFASSVSSVVVIDMLLLACRNA